MYDNDFGKVTVARSGNWKSIFFNNSLGTHFTAKSNEGWKFLYQILYQMVYTFIYIWCTVWPLKIFLDLQFYQVIYTKKTLKIEVSNKKKFDLLSHKVQKKYINPVSFIKDL